MSYKILAINPGSTSTKAAVYRGGKVVAEITVRHTIEELAGFDTIADQLEYRKDGVLDELRRLDPHSSEKIDAVIGRGGLVKPIDSGVYEINEALLDDLRSGRYGIHASNLGAMIAKGIADKEGARAFIADPVVVDELEDVARLTGIAGIKRRSIFHALNHKAIAKEYAASKGVPYESLNLIVCHLGGGISVGAHRRGRVVDVNNALDGEGPFSPERAGTIPACSMAELALSGEYSRRQITNLLAGKGGMMSLLGTNDMREVEASVRQGDQKAEEALEAMCYNICKAVGAMSAVLCGEVDAIILTGGIAYSTLVCDRIGRRCGFIAKIVVMPGENELDALASNALAVLEGRIEPKFYE